MQKISTYIFKLLLISTVVIILFLSFKYLNYFFIKNRLKLSETLCIDCKLEIPKVIHRIWIPFNEQNQTISAEYVKLDHILKNLHPDWKFVEWNEDKIKSFMQQEYPEYYDMYMQYDIPMKKHDASRYFILHKFGGVFIQHSIGFYKKIDNLLKGARVTFVSQQPNKFYLATSFISATPKHPFFSFVLPNLLKHSKEDNVLLATGPDFLSKTLKEYSISNKTNDIKIISNKFIFPFDWNEKNHDPIYSNCIADPNTRYDKCIKLYPDMYGYCLWKGEWKK